MFRILPNCVADAINAQIDAAIVRDGIDPDDFAPHRDTIFTQLVDYFDEHGTVPEINLRKLT